MLDKLNEELDVDTNKEIVQSDNITSMKQISGWLNG